MYHWTGMQCEFSWSHVQRTSIRVAAATSIQFSSDIYIYTIPREKRASIEMLIDRNVEIKQDLRISTWQPRTRLEPTSKNF